MVHTAREAGLPTASRRSPLEIAWNRKSWIVLAVVASLALGLVYYARLTPLYESKAQIHIVKKRPDSLTGIDSRSDDYTTTHKTLESRAIIEGAIKRRNL